MRGLGEDFDEGGFVELVEDAEDGKAADELGDEAVFEEVLGLGLAEEFGVALGADGCDFRRRLAFSPSAARS